MKNSVKKQITASMAQASVRTYFVAVSYNGESGADVPSVLCKVNASSKAVAEKRAIAQARAEFPRYSAFMAVAETLTPRKIKRFNRDFDSVKAAVTEAERWVGIWRRKVNKRLDDIINGNCAATPYLFQSLRNEKAILAKLETAWLLLLEMNDVINAK